MTTYKQAVIAMGAYFNTSWAGATTVVWGDNDPQDTPSGSWVRFNINHNDGRQASMGAPAANMFRQIGIITVQIFTAEGDSGVAARDLADSVLEIYHGARDSGIEYYNATAREIGNDGNGFYQVNVLVEFKYDNIT